MDEGRLYGKKKKNKCGREQTWLGDVWRFLCVAKSIRPCLFVLLLLLTASPGHWQDTAAPDAYAAKAQHRLPRTHLISLALPLTSYPPPLSLSSLSDVSYPISPCSPPPMLFSLNSSISLISHNAVIPIFSLYFRSSLMLCCLHSLPLLSLLSLFLICSLSLQFSQSQLFSPPFCLLLSIYFPYPFCLLCLCPSAPTHHMWTMILQVHCMSWNGSNKIVVAIFVRLYDVYFEVCLNVQWTSGESERYDSDRNKCK